MSTTANSLPGARVPVRFGRSRFVLYMTPLAAKCTYNEMFRYKGFLSVTGQRFGRLVAIERRAKNKDGKWLWSYRCDCGKTCVRLGSSVARGNCSSCGCLRNEVSLANLRKGCESFKKKARKAAA